MASQIITGVRGLFTAAKGLFHVVHAMDQGSFDAEALAPSPEAEGKFVAHYKCNLAIQRGMYFALRMPDWASEFKKQTHDILATTLKHHVDLPKEKPNNASGSQKKLRGCFYEEQLHSPPEESKPIRSPKIKDDITCGKRVPV
ncbi:uncharacterized protein [Drosophila pseudoobscura]|uniref:MICOS complex subunit MIC13 n=1 Tax=Drosophila pseudoobscura pseudoobscura TaxID=46245 RepID=A0A6I8V452_DROPS|nr:uncharacterized protein LOC6898430 [Drosophila pseudoobscura]